MEVCVCVKEREKESDKFYIFVCTQKLLKKNLEFRIENKDKTIKKNTILINRLQSENIELKTKVDSVLSDFQSRMFCEKSLQETLNKANQNINELTVRIHETFM